MACGLATFGYEAKNRPKFNKFQVVDNHFSIKIDIYQKRSFMSKCKTQLIVVLFGISLMSSTPTKAAEVFKSSEFLTYSKEGQSSYIRTSVGMTGLIAARNDKKHADCIDQWYFSDIDHGNQQIIAAMRKYPDYHPQAVIVAVLQKVCGSFTYANR